MLKNYISGSNTKYLNPIKTSKSETLLVGFVDRINDKSCENFQIAKTLSSLVIFPKYFSSIATVAHICFVSLCKYTIYIQVHWDTPGNAFRTNHSKSWIFLIKKV